MKTLFLSLIISLSAQAAPHGGESTGGGGADNQLLSQQAILEAVKHSRLSLYFFLHQAEYRLHRENAQVFAPLFQNRKDPFETLSRAKIEAKLSGDCKDPEGNSVDGSAFASEDHICINVDRLSKKLANSDEGRMAVMALVAHEFSHLVGADEEQAKAIQGAYLSGSDDNEPRFRRVDLAETLRWQMGRLEQTQKFIANQLDTAAKAGADSWKELDRLAGVLVYSLEGYAPNARSHDQYFGKLMHFRPEPFLQAGMQNTLISLFLKLETCAQAKTEEAAWGSTSRHAYTDIRNMTPKECQSYVQPMFKRAAEVPLGRFFGFAKGWGFIPSSAEILEEINGQIGEDTILLRHYDATNASLMMAEIKTIAADEKKRGSLAQLKKLYEQLTNQDFADFSVEIVR